MKQIKQSEHLMEVVILSVAIVVATVLGSALHARVTAYYSPFESCLRHADAEADAGERTMVRIYQCAKLASGG